MSALGATMSVATSSRTLHACVLLPGALATLIPMALRFAPEAPTPFSSEVTLHSIPYMTALCRGSSRPQCASLCIVTRWVNGVQRCSCATGMAMNSLVWQSPWRFFTTHQRRMLEIQTPRGPMQASKPGGLLRSRLSRQTPRRRNHHRPPSDCCSKASPVGTEAISWKVAWTTTLLGRAQAFMGADAATDAGRGNAVSTTLLSQAAGANCRRVVQTSNLRAIHWQ
mmetsp:Transcript_57767/g.161138  ORF Transcript_57767/g.161138 Transcript_57767/m.161138 type:complete len:225 (-) Transcript_57767:91-765(-)